MRVEDQVISFNAFKEADSPSDIDDCYRVDLVKESIEDNLLKDSPLISHEAFIANPVDIEEKKTHRNTKVVEALQYCSKSNPTKKVIEPSLSSSSHHKPYKKNMRKWKTKKKKYGEHHFKRGARGVLGASCLKLFPSKLKARWSKPFKETNVSLYGVTRRIKMNIQKLKEYLEGDLDQAKLSIASPNPT
ncbi:hypothetical protein PanWU01x14_358210 [Parasponia andersonii]|uniref:Uncharacterized protein n=1 Tax=Parasponia andersonii TaxID=3476 RepID=A0A2P5A8F9_PARAD|nr:hypothetical protein PanWU01x14_358210 [Parasponia andersonii]